MSGHVSKNITMHRRSNKQQIAPVGRESVQALVGPSRFGRRRPPVQACSGPRASSKRRCRCRRQSGEQSASR
eukprot:845605-Pleurochrysis_carterae.AAC.1